MADADFTVRLVDKVTRSARDISRSMGNLRGTFGAAGISAAALGPAIGVATAALAGLGIAAAGAAAAAAKVGSEMVKAASFAQKSTLAIEQLTHGMADAGAEFDEVRRMAQRLALPVDSTVKSFQKLLAAQFSIGQSKTFIKMGADLQAIGATTEEVQRALLAITQIKAKGRVMAEELLQLQEAGISQELVFEAIGKVTGLEGTAEIRKAIEAGEISSDVALPAILEAVSKKTGSEETGDAGKRFANTTLEGFRGQLTGGLRNAFIDMGREVTPEIETIVGLMQGTFGKLQESGKLDELKDSIVNAFQSAALFIEVNWPTIESVITDAIDGVIMATDALAKTFDFLSEHSSTLEPIFRALMVVFKAFGAAILTQVAIAGALVAAILAIPTTVLHAIGVLMEQVAQWKQLGRDFIMGMVEGIQSALGSVVSAARNVGSSAIGAIRNELGIASPSKVMAEMGAFTGEGMAQGVEASVPRVSGAAAEIGGASIESASAAASAGGGRAGGDVVVNVNVAAPADGSAEGAQQWGAMAGQAIRSEVAQLLESMAAA